MNIIYKYHSSNIIQSACKLFHSTDTVLLKIHNDIIVDNMNNSKVTTLDISAAFDTIDGSILLQSLIRYFAISGTVRRWFKSHFFGQMPKH